MMQMRNMDGILYQQMSLLSSLVAFWDNPTMWFFILLYYEEYMLIGTYINL